MPEPTDLGQERHRREIEHVRSLGHIPVIRDERGRRFAIFPRIPRGIAPPTAPAEGQTDDPQP